MRAFPKWFSVLSTCRLASAHCSSGSIIVFRLMRLTAVQHVTGRALWYFKPGISTEAQPNSWNVLLLQVALVGIWTSLQVSGYCNVFLSASYVHSVTLECLEACSGTGGRIMWECLLNWVACGPVSYASPSPLNSSYVIILMSRDKW